ncbi:MAG: DUF2490 domain-containing protein [Erythrobacter sp.]|uniref:DUF2490 domain-containing protein n=1 Tax=Erythrobacter sp. TaxID=1042 RepID=UPI002638F995|nr:DUF2490 domain-containing protein [Erythrobacter sp.]MDJ0978809.1 DUF2490 domain-containing protein [Erythrobacter sp.]
MATTPCAAHATDDDIEFWFNPTIAVALDEDTSVKLETAQRLRRESEGRPDTYFFRLWAKQKVSSGLTLAGAVERRINDGRRDEVRTMQQATGRYSVARMRLRLEQRFAENSGGRMGLRVRARIGADIPLDGRKTWFFSPDIESFVTLRNSNPGGDIGKSEMRTQIAVAHKVSENLKLKAGYLMQYDLEQREVETVGHAPILGLHSTF